MNGFLYFIPGASAVGDSALRDLGLAGIDPKHYEQGPINAGPGGGAGVLIRASGGKGKLGYNKAAQTWIAGPDKKFFLGFETAAPPRPADLARERMVPGTDVELGDENKWHVPIARHHAYDTIPWNLPQIHGVNADGENEMRIAPGAQKLWDAGCALWAHYLATARGDEGSLTYDDEFGFACMALGTNYRLGPLEIRALGLIRTDIQIEISKVLFDLDGFYAATEGMDDEESSAEGNGEGTSSG